MAFPGDVYSEKCSARDALALIAGKWVMLILPIRQDGSMRNGELLGKIEGISQKVRTQTLLQLQRYGLIARDDYFEKPACVEYRLIEVAYSLVATLAILDRWAEHNCPVLDAAREKYDAAQSVLRYQNPDGFLIAEPHENSAVIPGKLIPFWLNKNTEFLARLMINQPGSPFQAYKYKVRRLLTSSIFERFLSM